MMGSWVSQAEAEAEQEEVAEEEPPQFVAPAVGRLLLKISTAAPMGRILCPEEGCNIGWMWVNAPGFSWECRRFRHHTI